MERKPRKPVRKHIHLVVDRSLDSTGPNGIERRGKGSRPQGSQVERRASMFESDTIQEPKMFKFNILYLMYGAVIAAALAIAAVQYGNYSECKDKGGRYMKEIYTAWHECVLPPK